MLVKRIIHSIFRNLKYFFELILTTLLIVLIISIPNIFLSMGDLKQYAVILMPIYVSLECCVAFCGYQYLIKRSDIIFERVNIQKLIFVMMMIISTLLIMNYGIPAIFSNNQSSGINEKNIDILLNGSIGWLPVLLFKFSLVVLGPVIEEIYFRGIMFEEAQTLGKFVQIVWPTVIFSAIHFPLTLEQWVTYSVAGGMLMLVRVLTKRLQYSIIFHILHNFIVLVS